MSECLAIETLFDLVGGRLAPAELASVEVHLDRCATCFRVLTEIVAPDGDEAAAQPPWPRRDEGR